MDAVRRAADIADVVGETVALRRAGRSLTGLCPFHHEKTPSFHVDPAKQLYYCFGCGAGGDVFKFVMEIHGVEFSDAVGLLADRYGIPRPSQRDGADAADDRRRRRMLAALEAAHSFFVETLAGPQG
ncbi:MAG: DNA primase, partial [Acidobacteria bacterium]|nr:DNA primase [Acidobacteriota bacterium]